MLVGRDRRDLLVAALHGQPVGVTMLDVIEELAGLGLIRQVHAMVPVGLGLEVVLTESGQAEARRQWSVAWWMRWRDLAREIENRSAADLEERLELARVARRARQRATEAFDRVMAEGVRCA